MNNILTSRVNVLWILEGDPALAQSVCVSGNTPSNRGSSRVGSGEDDAPCTAPLPTCMSAAHVSQTFSSTRNLSLLDYPSYMARLLATEEITPLSSPGAGSTETSPTIRGNVSHACRCNYMKQLKLSRRNIAETDCEQNRNSIKNRKITSVIHHM